MLASSEHEQNIEKMKNLISQLLSMPAFKIVDIIAHQSNHDIPGVYLLLDPRDIVVYVGATSKGIAHRMKDHLLTTESSDLKGMLSVYSSFPQDRYSYTVKYIGIGEARERTQFEHFVIAILNPPFNK